MVMCLDSIDCRYENREKSRFCAHCGLPVPGALLQGRYEIQSLASKDRSTATILAQDRHQHIAVTIRALLPNFSSEQERRAFLEDAELASSLSDHVSEPGSIRVIDYGQDGPIAFLVKTDTPVVATEKQPSRPRMTFRVEQW